jgi:hypothetical protein
VIFARCLNQPTLLWNSVMVCNADAGKYPTALLKKEAGLLGACSGLERFFFRS